jgi:hypothetical protein
MQAQGIELVEIVTHSTPVVHPEFAERTWPFEPMATRQTLEGPAAASMSPLVVTTQQDTAAGFEDAPVMKPLESTVILA